MWELLEVCVYVCVCGIDGYGEVRPCLDQYALPLVKGKVNTIL